LATKISRTYRLTQTAVDYITSFSDAENLSATDALERIIREHKAAGKEQTSMMAKSIVKEFDEHYKNLFTRLRLASSQADFNVQVALEILNTLTVTQDASVAYTSRLGKGKAWEAGEAEVKRRIAEYKQHKDNKPKKSDEDL
jgi:hypothetical protein